MVIKKCKESRNASTIVYSKNNINKVENINIAQTHLPEIQYHAFPIVLVGLIACIYIYYILLHQAIHL